MIGYYGEKLVFNPPSDTLINVAMYGLPPGLSANDPIDGGFSGKPTQAGNFVVTGWGWDVEKQEQTFVEIHVTIKNRIKTEDGTLNSETIYFQIISGHNEFLGITSSDGSRVSLSNNLGTGIEMTEKFYYGEENNLLGFTLEATKESANGGSGGTIVLSAPYADDVVLTFVLKDDNEN